MNAPDRNRRWLVSAAAVAVCAMAVAMPRAQGPVPEGRGKAYDELLDLNVRDGLVYYRALKGQRGRLDGYVSSLADVAIDVAPRDEQMAFWLNAYNAVVLQTVVDQLSHPAAIT